MRNLLSLILLFSCTLAFSQKKVLDHTVFNAWNKIERSIISSNGHLVAYEINPHQGDGSLIVHNTVTNKIDTFPRAKEAQFSYLNDFVVFKIVPGIDTLRKCELEKIDKKKWPKDSLGIYVFEKDTLIKVAKLKSFKISQESNQLAYLIDDNTLDDPKNAKKKKKHLCKNKKQAKDNDYKSDGTILTFFDPQTLSTLKIKDVTEYTFSKNGQINAITTHKKEKIDSFSLTLYSNKHELIHAFPKAIAYRQQTFSEDGKRFAYLQSADTAKIKQFQLQLFDLQNKSFSSIADTSSNILPTGKAISENYQPLFTDNGKHLYFGVADRIKPEVKDSLLESEKPKVDVWHYQDERLQSQQLKELKNDQKKSHLYLYSFADGQIIQLSNDTMDVRPIDNLQGDYIFAQCEKPYALMNQWDPERVDHYRISVLDGKVEPLKKEIRIEGLLSPNGKNYVYFNETTNQYILKDPVTGAEECITCSQKNVSWQREMNGIPALANTYGVIGFTPNEEEILIQSEYDIYNYSISNKTLSCLTNLEGQKRKIRLSATLWSSDSIYYTPASMYIQGFNEKTKGSHIFQLVKYGIQTDFVEKYYTDHKINSIVKAKESNKVILRKMSVKDYPEVRLTDIDFTKEEILSNTNPQQDEYNWARVELTSWKSYNGISLEGLVYKPENFDATKQYPMLIYFYELYSDDLHNHYVPKPSASIIHPTEYASAGYIVFIPDIRYKSGYPAKGAYDCIMSGTDHLLKLLPNIDAKRMGLQGQSWGGYQTAQLITMTDRFAAAMAGAPVSNMFSAYGGIRWGSGVNRQFQYEKGQSRIGKTIWEAPELYFENSPLFHLPNVKTPLLIMHNDEDGAVPWYQGIELFTGMRRLGNPCWMLNYNGDDHNIMKNANRIDLSIRMKQFFDHYLMGQPAPSWLTNGIPALDKGKVTGY